MDLGIAVMSRWVVKFAPNGCSRERLADVWFDVGTESEQPLHIQVRSQALNIIGTLVHYSSILKSGGVSK